MCLYDLGYEPPFEVYTPCCSYVRAYVRKTEWSEITKLCKNINIKYNWRCCYRGFPPYFELYISKDNLTEKQLESLKNRVPILSEEELCVLLQV
jgi:hypothetical protein